MFSLFSADALAHMEKDMLALRVELDSKESELNSVTTRLDGETVFVYFSVIVAELTSSCIHYCAFQQLGKRCFEVSERC